LDTASVVDAVVADEDEPLVTTDPVAVNVRPL
jgi:hypothetical protein